MDDAWIQYVDFLDDDEGSCDDNGSAVAPEKALTMKINPKMLGAGQWESACAFLRQSTTLKHIKITHLGADARRTYDQFSAMFDVTKQYMCPLESILLPYDCRNRKDCLVRRRHMQIIIKFMLSRPSAVWRLCIGARLGDGCIGEIIQGLNKGLRICNLQLADHYSEGPIGEDGVERLICSDGSSHLLKLKIHNAVMSSRVCEAVTSFLRREDASIETIDVGQGDREHSQMLLESIPVASKLRKIHLGRMKSDATAVQTLENLVCNRTDLNSLCLSNHNIYFVGYSTGQLKSICPVLREALDINERQGCSNVQKARSKLRAFYFQDDFDIHPFINMDVELMPNVLELVTMSEECIAVTKKGRLEKGTYVSARNGNLSGIYRLVRNCHLPELFSFPSPAFAIKQMEARIAALEAQLQSQITSMPSKRLKLSDA